MSLKGFLAIWTVSPAGVLSPTAQILTIPGPGYGPFSLTAVPGKDGSYVSADASLGADVFSISAGAFGKLKLSETTLNISGQGAVCWSSYSRQTGDYYLNDLLTGIITEVALNSKLQLSIVTVSRAGDFVF